MNAHSYSGAKVGGNLSKLAFATEYRSSKEDPAASFYRPCLLNSTQYRRAVGYFRSTVYQVIGPTTLDFARLGGRIQLICSPELSQEDIDGISAGYAKRSQILEQKLIAEIDRLLIEDSSAYRTRVLATLIAADALDIKIALRADRKGIYHEKIGIFSDNDGNRVSFKGSANETWSGWHADGNFESIEVFCSWRGGLEAERVQRHQDHFDSLWSGSDSHVEVFSFPNRAREYLNSVAFIGGLEAVELPPIESSSSRRTALPHQSAALSSWADAGYRGVFAHATGSGKTFTAILGIKEHLDQGNPAIVLVPSQLLLEQWADEIRDELPKAALLLAGGGHSDWKKRERLRGMTLNDGALGPRVVLSTMQTASTPVFMGQIAQGDHLLVIGDEVHQIGSPQNSKFLSVDAGKRLGLSATPERYGDPDGTQKIFDYFGSIIEPKITLNDAIHAGRLVEYEYYPHAINLTADEAAEWKRITLLVRQEMARQKQGDDGKRPLSERAKMLLIQRSRIAKKAAKKVELARDVLRREYEEGQHWLVYCEDADQLGAVVNTLKAEGLAPIEYHSSMPGDRDATMSWFKTFGGPLVSIRCLDEGVDIPAVSHALILASSQNPRQFIQRRGRVLRRATGKHIAVLHDAIVVPVSLDDEPEQTSLLKAEMLRSVEFANNAINKMAAAELRNIAARLGFEADALSDAAVEEDDDGDQ